MTDILNFPPRGDHRLEAYYIQVDADNLATRLRPALTSEMDHPCSQSATQHEELRPKIQLYQLFGIPQPKGSNLLKGSILPSDQVEKLMAVAREGPLDAFMAAWKDFDLNSQVGDEPFLESYNNSSKVGEHACLVRDLRVVSDPLSLPQQGRTALHIAAANGQLDIVRTICAVRDIEVNIRTNLVTHHCTWLAIHFLLIATL
jgi:hypothetical protein